MDLILIGATIVGLVIIAITPTRWGIHSHYTVTSTDRDYIVHQWGYVYGWRWYGLWRGAGLRWCKVPSGTPVSSSRAEWLHERVLAWRMEQGR